MYFLSIHIIFVLCAFVNANYTNLSQKQPHQFSLQRIQQQNIEILEETIQLGWKTFCESPVDETVMSLHNGINPSDASIHVMTLTNHSVELPIKSLSEICDFDIDPKRKTLLYVNAYFTSETYFSVCAHLKLLQTTRRDLNIIVVDFAKNIQQLYYTLRYNVVLYGDTVAKILTTLTQHGIKPQDITLAGHSIGANIAALGATLYANNDTNHMSPTKGTKIGQMIAIDPALMCQSKDIYVQPNISSRVVVIHSEGDIFGVRNALGTIDIYPNGIGYYLTRRKKLQPGCETKLCSHMYSFAMFMEALIESAMIPAVRCNTWLDFRKGICDYNNTVAIGLTYPQKAKGIYFCVTQPSPPYTFMEHGLKYKKRTVSSSSSKSMLKFKRGHSKKQ